MMRTPVLGTVIVTLAMAAGQQVPLFEPDPLWSEALPNKWVTGHVGGLAVDSHDHLWIFHRPATSPDGEKAASLVPRQAECCIPAPPVLEFDTHGIPRLKPEYESALVQEPIMEDVLRSEPETFEKIEENGKKL